MDNLIMLQLLSYVAAAIGVCIAAFYYILTLWNNNRTRHAQLFMQLSNELWSKEQLEETAELFRMEWDDLNDFYRKYDSSVNPKNYALRASLWNKLDATGLLLKKGLIDREMVYYLLGGFYAIWIWKKFEPIIKHDREALNLPEYNVWFEYLSNETARMRKEHGYTDEVPKGWDAVKSE
jgi:hypothetical protein